MDSKVKKKTYMVSEKESERQGKLIIIEGTDGSGKETQSKLLIERLKKEGYKVEYAEFPQYGKPSATMVEQYLNGKLGTAEEVGPYRASILYAVDRYAKSEQMKAWLKQGKIIICNRYVSASKGHQAGKIDDKQERKRFLKWLDELEYNIFSIPKPDSVFLLVMPHDIAQKLIEKKGDREYLNGKKKDIHEQDLEHIKKAEKAYMDVAEEYNWNIITCNKKDEPLSVKEINDELYKRIKDEILLTQV